MVTAGAIWEAPSCGGHNRHPTVSITTQLTVLQRTIFRPADGGDADELGPVSVEVVWRVRRDLLVDADQGPVFDQPDLKKTRNQMTIVFKDGDSTKWEEYLLMVIVGMSPLCLMHPG